MQYRCSQFFGDGLKFIQIDFLLLPRFLLFAETEQFEEHFGIRYHCRVRPAFTFGLTRGPCRCVGYRRHVNTSHGSCTYCHFICFIISDPIMFASLFAFALICSLLMPAPASMVLLAASWPSTSFADPSFVRTSLYACWRSTIYEISVSDGSLERSSTERAIRLSSEPELVRRFLTLLPAIGSSGSDKAGRFFTVVARRPVSRLSMILCAFLPLHSMKGLKTFLLLLTTRKRLRGTALRRQFLAGAFG